MSKPILPITEVVTPDGEAGSKKDPYTVLDTNGQILRKTVHLDNPLNQFAEYEEVCSLISTLPNVCNDQISREASHERFLGKRVQLPFLVLLAKS